MIYQNLLNSITTGYLDQSYNSNIDLQPQLILNDKSRQKKVLTSIISELNTCDYFEFSVAFLTTGGVAVLINTLDALERKGIKGRIVVSKYLNFTQPQALRRLLKYDNIEVRIDISHSFHAKCYIFKKNQHYSIIVGSSNLTDTALSKNYEFNLKIDSLHNSSLANDIIEEQEQIVKRSIVVNDEFISAYEEEFNEIHKIRNELNQRFEKINNTHIQPNTMQQEALKMLNNLRVEENAKKALIISATGTGKTFLSAFDVASIRPKRVLFLVHRSTIAKKSLKSFQKILNNDSISYGIFDAFYKQIKSDYLFSTVQTMSIEKNLFNFQKDHFDYIIIDETHRAAAKSYSLIMNHFTPKFLLGMTATPERTDGEDIFSLFDHNIAYEIRLNQALEAGLLTTFHYYGITDLEIDGEVIDDKTTFNLLTSDQRIQHLLSKIKHYSTDTGEYRALVFCSNVEEAEQLALAFNNLGHISVALSGKSSEKEREQAMFSIENNCENRIEFIFTVDIFNEGVDIPKINLIVMLRSTQSSIVFVQQLGRGLRKADDKSYLTILDFIGNYENNYLIPIALFGDTSYNKDRIRKAMSEGSSLIPGASTVDFDVITKQRIFDSINKATINKKKDLATDYKLLKYKLGRRPAMIDFVIHGSRDPYNYVSEYKSFYNAFKMIEKDNSYNLSMDQENILSYFDSEINNTIRIIETYLLFVLLEDKEELFIDRIKLNFEKQFKFKIKNVDILSAIRNINFDFVTIKYEGRLVSYRYSKFLKNTSLYNVIEVIDDSILFSNQFKSLISNSIFLIFLNESITCALHVYEQKLITANYQVEKGFILYEKYSRKDVFRILNWNNNPVAQNVGGYLISKDNRLCPIFVNYHKDDDITDSTKYDDGFIDNQTFQWMSKSGRTLESSDVRAIKQHLENEMKLFLFIKKDNDEGKLFYFMGLITPEDSSFTLAKLPGGNGNKKNVVKLNFKLTKPVKDTLYNYIVNK